MAELLFELGSEELPARFVVPALEELERLFVEKCKAKSIKHGAIRRFGTPRRLALLVADVIEKTDDITREAKGPAVKAAFDEQGNPREPAKKFAQSVGLPVEKLLRLTTPKGEYLGALIEEKGRATLGLLPELLSQCLEELVFPKSMRWGDVEQSFARPLHWIVALLGADVVPLVFSDVKSGRITKGHRFLAPAPITIDRPHDYERLLTKAHVVPDVHKRRTLLLERLEAAVASAKARLLRDDALIEEVVNLVELPNPVVGTFEARHLDLPPEVLIQEMRSHQRYFSLLGDDGKIVPKFIAVSNTPVKDEALSVRGYERVLRARLTDGRFFFDEDRLTPLAERATRLHRRTWLAPLGTMAEKAERIAALAAALAKTTGHARHLSTIERAALLCKADLETGMVGEFPELQGVMGREYALHAKEPAAVALAIFEHYLPRNAQDTFPTEDAGALIGLADRLDSIVGLFAIGKRPTGAKDEGGSRRACLAIINLTIQRGYRYSLEQVVDQAIGLLEPKLKDVKKKDKEPPLKAQVLDFFRGRLEALWQLSHRPDVIDAVLAVGFDDLARTQLRLAAMSALVGRPDFAPLASTFKRVANIVEKQAKGITRAPVEAGRLVDAAEKSLAAEVGRVRETVHEALSADDFSGALARVAPLKAPVDTFFEKVMVMTDDQPLRENRVRLLMEIAALFGTVADFSRIQGDGGEGRQS